MTKALINFRGKIASCKATPAEHNGHICSRASTQHDAIFDGKKESFLLYLHGARKMDSVSVKKQLKKKAMK